MKKLIGHTRYVIQQTLCLLLAIVMLAGLVPSSAFAALPYGDYSSRSSYEISPYWPLPYSHYLSQAETNPTHSYYSDQYQGNHYQDITAAATPFCDNPNIVATGNMGNVTAINTPSLGLPPGTVIPGAIWEYCDNCHTITIAGGAINMPDNTNTLSQSRFPAAIRPYVQRVVFTEPLTAGTSLQCLFHGLTSLTEIQGIDYIDTTAVRNMRRMFMYTHSLQSFDLSNFYTGSVTNMYRMFNGTGAETLNLGGEFNTGGLVENFGLMFWNAHNLKSIGDTSAWDTSSATRMPRMFQGTHNLQYLDVSSWDTSNVTLMYNMFHLTQSLTTLTGISNWDVRQVTRMDNMFSNTGMAHLDLSGWVTESLLRMDNMFDNNAPNLISLDVRGFITSGVVNRNHLLNVRSAPISLQEFTIGPDWYWNVFNAIGLPNPPNNETYTGYWIQVGTGTADNPAGPVRATTAQLMDNSLLPNDIVATWVWERRHPLVESPIIPFNFHKTDQRLSYSLPVDASTDWDEINSFLLPDAQFALYKWNDPYSSPAAPDDMVTPGNSGADGQWIRVDDGTSSGDVHSPLVFELDSEYRYFQLVEIATPVGFYTPQGQWRIVLEYDVNLDDIGNQGLGWQYAKDNWWMRIITIGDPLTPSFVRQPANNYVNDELVYGAGDWYVYNKSIMVLPLMFKVEHNALPPIGFALLLLATGLLFYKPSRAKLPSRRQNGQQRKQHLR